MAKKKQQSKSNANYKKSLKELRKYYNFSFDLRNALTPARKAAITRAQIKYEKQVKPALDRGGKFQPATRTKRRKVRDVAGKSATTSKGFILMPPKDSEKIDFVGDAVVSFVGEAIFKMYSVGDPVAFARDPDAFIKQLPDYKHAVGIRVNVGEQQYYGTQKYDPSQFTRYITKDLPGFYTDHGSDRPEDFITGVTLVFIRGKNNQIVKRKGKR